MGKIVKGARVSAERYTVVVPSIRAAAASREPSSEIDEYGFAVFETDAAGIPYDSAAAGAAIPKMDVEAVERQAAALIDEAAASAEAMLADAHERARAMIEDAAQRADAIAEEARASAHEEGFAQGAHGADREMSEMLATMRNLVDMARIERHKIITQAEPELVRLAMGIAERVLHQQIALDRGVVVEMARSAISRLLDRESITVRVNPSDLDRMREHREDVLAIGEVKNLRIIEDQRVDRGGVIVETDGGSVDAKISTQVSEAKKILHIEDEVIVQPANDSESRSLRTARAS
ncbi:MAG: hypothetical protein NVSMB5_17190 [Candidatus Velthaea sp.]